jgi:endonuclease YncB( thermonuclease family)
MVTVNVLEDCRLDNINSFNLNGYVCKAKILRCHDADTITIALQFMGTFYKFIVRLAGIDSFELKSENEILRNKAIIARNKLLDLLTGNTISKYEYSETYFKEHVIIVDIHCNRFDKYGRLLGEIFIDGINVNKYLLDNGLAYVYSGGTKLTDNQQLTLK